MTDSEKLILYMGVRCHTDRRHLIPLKALSKYEEVFDLVGVTPFPAYCSRCKTTQQYKGIPVVFWYEPPIKNFQDHPTFR
jgi:hypothetical protein